MPSVDLFPFLLPLLAVTAGALVVLAMEAFLPRLRKHAVLPWLAIVALIAALGLQLGQGTGHLMEVLALDTARNWLCIGILVSAGISIAALQVNLVRDDFPGGEPYCLILTATVGAMLMVMAVDTIVLFLGLELASLSVYALVGLRRDRLESNEALFKYFAMGAVFSAIFLYGAALTYGATGSTLIGNPVHGHDLGTWHLFLLGQALMMIGLLFKVGAVPFHFWAPDAYTGAPMAVTGFMASVLKIGGFTALGAIWLNLVSIVSGTHGPGILDLGMPVLVGRSAEHALAGFQAMLLVVALLSLWLGNFSALRQTSVRRLIAFSSIAHAGAMLLAFTLPQGAGGYSLSSLWFYLIGYGVATAGAMAGLAALTGRNDTEEDIAALTGRGRQRPFHGLAITICFASFAGVPPTAGFLGKYMIYAELVAKGQVLVAVFAMIMAVVGAAYYFRLVIALWSGERTTRRGDRLLSLNGWTLVGATAVVILLIVAPGLCVSPGKVPASAHPLIGAQR